MKRRIEACTWCNFQPLKDILHSQNMHSSYVWRHYDVIKPLNQNFEGRLSILMSVVRDYALKNENQVNSFDAQVTIVVHFV